MSLCSIIPDFIVGGGAILEDGKILFPIGGDRIFSWWRLLCLRLDSFTTYVARPINELSSICKKAIGSCFAGKLLGQQFRYLSIDGNGRRWDRKV